MSLRIKFKYQASQLSEWLKIRLEYSLVLLVFVVTYLVMHAMFLEKIGEQYDRAYLIEMTLRYKYNVTLQQLSFMDRLSYSRLRLVSAAPDQLSTYVTYSWHLCWLILFFIVMLLCLQVRVRVLCDGYVKDLAELREVAIQHQVVLR